MIHLKTRFVDLEIKEPDNDKEREILRQDLVSANALMLAALQIFETDELGGATLVYLPDNDHQSH
tara:strand:- start:379 stop:573 length:195 start_codon:yes stop_codon:yes gene_type:complete